LAEQNITFRYCGLGSTAFPMNAGWLTVPVKVACTPVKDGAELVPAGVKVAVEFVGTPLGQVREPVGVKVTVPFVPVGVKLAVELVGTELLPVGQEIVPDGVKLTVPLLGTPLGQAMVPAAVSVCVCPAKADPANVGCVKLPAVMVGTPEGQAIVG
jgi:hypothetical protein